MDRKPPEGEFELTPFPGFKFRFFRHFQGFWSIESQQPDGMWAFFAVLKPEDVLKWLV